MSKFNEREMCNRALSAYFRIANQLDGVPIQPSASVVEHVGLSYVHLGNVNGTIAVYRIRIVNGEPVLKGLKRWPKELDNV